jgi:hypothetical protein
MTELQRLVDEALDLVEHQQPDGPFERAALLLAKEVRRMRGTSKRVLSFIAHPMAFIVGPTGWVIVTGVDKLPRESPLELPEDAKVLDVPKDAKPHEIDALAKECGGIPVRVWLGAKPEMRHEMSIGEALEIAEAPRFVNMSGLEDPRLLRPALDVITAELRKEQAE